MSGEATPAAPGSGRGGWRGRLASWLMIRAGEWQPVLWSFAYFFCLLSGYFSLRPLRESIGVATGVANLQYLFSGTFVVMLLMLPLYGWLVARFPKRIFLPAVYGFFLLNLLAFQQALSVEQPSQWVGWAYFVWLSVFNLFVVSVFWSFMADIFNSEQGKRLFGVIAAGGSAGAIVGPLVTAVIVPDVGYGGVLMMAAALLGLALLCQFMLLKRLDSGPPGPDSEGVRPGRIGGSVWAGALLVFRSRYLGGLAGVLLLTTLLQSLMYFQQADLVGQYYAGADPTRFFAVVDAATNTLAVVLQLFLTSRLLSRFGVARMLALMPLLTAVGFAVLAVAPGAILIGVIQVIRRAGEYGLMKPARDLLYTRVNDESRYKAKNFIDTVVYRGGDLASGWAYKGLNGGLRIPLEGIALLAVPIALLWTWLAYRLGLRFESRTDQ